MQVFSLNNKGLKFIELSHAAAIGIKRAQGMWVAGSAVLYRIGTKSDADFVTTLTAADLCVYSHSFGPVIVGFDTARLLRGPSACLFTRAHIGKGLGSFFIGKKGSTSARCGQRDFFSAYQYFEKKSVVVGQVKAAVVASGTQKKKKKPTVPTQKHPPKRVECGGRFFESFF